jgi:predicted NAD/FAD-dependent oxidoreductase/deoxyribodipyrimidine photolyase
MMTPHELDLGGTGLPEHLRERVRPLRPGPVGRGRVLVWLRSALRAHENPALDVALTVAAAQGLPVLVYQGLSERHPFANDRHHTFLMEGARDLAVDLAKRGIPYVFHLERPGHRGPVLKQLAQDASLIVLDDVPMDPLERWARALAEASPAPVWAVDCALVLPMSRSRAAPTRAYTFREAFADERARRLALPWRDAPAPALPPDPGPLPFAPVPIATATDAELQRLVAACAIDHGVGPVPDTRGGGAAGRARWRAFVGRGGLLRYARDRKDPLKSGVSRMSAYLPHGMVSPFALAREAAATPGDGAAKFLDELLIWRELAWHWCAHTPAPRGLEALPGWARETLAASAKQRRPGPSWERLSRAESGWPLWDLCQASLLRHGELHNNLRMTWGKALVDAAGSPEEALERLVDLNDRFALDGRDPASVGGLYWCLGLFDRPFPPPSPRIGALRPRPLAEHAARLDLPALEARLRPPARARRVAVIGAGVAGLACARALVDHGLEVELFDKGRGPGGRLSTRRADGAAFDHGAQYFSARDPAFARHVAAWEAEGVVARWEARGGFLHRGELTPTLPMLPRYVAVPGMSALARHLAEGLTVRTGAQVVGLSGGPGAWAVHGPEGVLEDGYAFVLITTPAPQAVPLLGPSPRLQARAAAASYLPCQAVMARFDGPLGLPFDVARPLEGPLSWIARGGSKPGRPAEAGESWVLHARPGWSLEHLDDDADAVRIRLLAAFAACTGIREAPIWSTAHRWRYALCEGPFDEGAPADLDPAAGLGVAGDWLGGARVEGAWRSGRALAGRVLGWIARGAGLNEGDE